MDNTKKDTAVNKVIENISDELNGSVRTIVIREDDALVVHEEKAINVSGTLDSPVRWLDKRLTDIEPLSAHVLVDRDAMSVQLITEERNHFSNSITGRLEFHPAFKKFGINAGEYITPAAMADKIKMNRSFFESKSEAMALVSILKNFKAKIDAEIEKSDDNKGNRKVLVQQTVSSNLPASFKMVLPIFKGEKPKTIEVEVYIEADEFTCTLISPEANEEMEHLRDTAINLVIEQIFAVNQDIVIIEK